MPSHPTSDHARSESPRGSGRGWFRLGLLGVLALAVGGSTLAVTSRSLERTTTDYAFFNPLIDVKAMLSEYFVEDLDDEALQQAAIEGMIEAVGDPYTVYVPPTDRDDFERTLTGEYAGIGAEVIMRDGVFTIVSPLDDSPALKSGLQADDRVLEIDGVSTEGESVDANIDRVLGTPGTPVTLTIQRGTDEPFEVEVVRDRIKTRAVRGVARNADGEWQYLIDDERRIAFVRLSQFTPGSGQELRDVLVSLGGNTPATEGGLGGLVLDLRWNPGGLLNEAITMADLFLDEGVIVSTRGRAYEDQTAQAKPGDTLANFPLVILINGQSASASEVLSGALDENGRAVVVGTRSFGKGSVQSVRALPSLPGAQLKMTEQGYYLPSGRSLHRRDDSAVWGVDPTNGYFVPLTEEQTIELVRVRRDQDVLRTGEDASDGDLSTPEAIAEVLADPQLAVAIEALDEWIDRGERPVREGDAQAQAAADALQGAELTRSRLLRELERLDRRIDAISTAADLSDVDRSEYDLWDDETVVEGGELIVRDAEGNEVTRLRITGENLERWLIDAGVEPVVEQGPEPTGLSTPGGEPEGEPAGVSEPAGAGG